MFTRLAGSLLFASGVLAITPNAAVAEPPSPLELVRGLRTHDEPKLALEYLQVIEKKLSTSDAEVVSLERALCILELAKEAPKADMRTRLAEEVKKEFENFLKKHPNHPQELKAKLSLAQLTAINAKTRWNLIWNIVIPPEDDPGHEKAVDEYRQELQKTHEMFHLAIRQFSDVSKQCKTRLEDKALDPIAKQALARELLDAEFNAALNEYRISQMFSTTYVGTGPPPREVHLEKARSGLETVAKGPQNNPLVWVAQAWLAEVLAEQGNPTESRTEFATVLNTPRFEAEGGKRLARFFQIRRDYLDTLTEGTLAKLSSVEGKIRSWLVRYGNHPRPDEEVTAARYFLANTLQRQAQVAIARIPEDTKPLVLSDAIRKQLGEAEKLYRLIGQSDNPYTDRTSVHQKTVARWLNCELESDRYR